MDSNGQEFSGWTRTVLGTIIVPFTEKVFGDHNYEVLTSSRNGIQRQSEHFAGKQRHDTDGYNIIPRGYCTYRNRSDDGLFTFNMNNIVDEGIVSKFYPVFTFQNANRTFMMEYLNGSPRVRAKLSVLAVGTSQVVLSFETLKETSFYLPTFEEQNRIAALLSALNERIEKQRLLIEHLKKYKRGLHKQVFSPKPHWSVKPLRDIATFCGGGTPSKDVSKYWQGSIGWISSSDVQEDWIDEISISRRITEEAIANSATKLCSKGTIAIISRVGVGKVAIMPEDLCTSQDYTNITTIDGDVTFFAYQIAHKMKIEASKTQGTAIKGVTADTIKSMEMDIPDLHEQCKIATTLQKLDYRIKYEIQLLTLLQNAKRSLLQQLFI